jgi:ATP-dependent RNA helicase RhlE
MSYFSSLGLAEPILRALEAKGYTDPTPIQQQAIPALLAGRDLLGIAQTGTGKTAAFALPSLHRLAANPKPRQPASCRMLVLSPTRELAAQIADNMRGYAKNLQMNVQCIFGGVPVGKQSRALVPGCDVLVATPGRLLDLIDQRALTLRNVEIFVLDEADQMMDLGFIHPLKRVANMLPKDRQSLFFSATMPKAIADLGKQFINNPVRVEVAPQATTAERVEQYVTFIDQREKQALLTLRLKAIAEDGTLDRALVFSRTKHGADRIARHLGVAGVAASAIHGNKSQGQRTAALNGFRSGAIRVLVATDIAARGIDVSGVSHVFNFEMPNVAEQYVHRIGRTARAGADGIAWSFVAGDEKPYLKDIEKLTGVKLMPLPLPADFQAQASKLPLPLKSAETDDRGGRRDMGRGGRDGGNRGGGGRGGERSGGARPSGERSGGERSGGGGYRPDGDRGSPNRHRSPARAGDVVVRGEPRAERSAEPRAERAVRPLGVMPDRARPEAPRSDAPRRDAPQAAKPHAPRPAGAPGANGGQKRRFGGGAGSGGNGGSGNYRAR